MNTSAATSISATVLVDDDRILDIDDIASRYGIGRTKAYELAKSPGFPATVVPGMTRIPLQALRAYERAQLLTGTVATDSSASTAAVPIHTRIFARASDGLGRALSHPASSAHRMWDSQSAIYWLRRWNIGCTTNVPATPPKHCSRTDE